MAGCRQQGWSKAHFCRIQCASQLVFFFHIAYPSVADIDLDTLIRLHLLLQFLVLPPFPLHPALGALLGQICNILYLE